ncbi:MAG: chemotaxis protein CheW [Planctomycetaceae bacterium]
MTDRRRAAAPRVEAPMPECWRIVGVTGDRSCPELATFVHCRNCPVLAEAARTFFDRPAPEGYLDDWRTILEEPPAAAEAGTSSVLVFRLGREWFALPAAVLVEVTAVRTVHRIPHRIDGGLAGLVNIRGQLQLSVSLHVLLGLTGGPAADGATARLLVVERAGDEGRERWVLAADEVAGVHRLAPAETRAAPATVGHAQARCTAALFAWQDRTVGLLDAARLFEGLRGMVSA